MSVKGGTYNIADRLKIKTRVLATFLGQNCVFSSFLGKKMFDIELNPQFCLKNVARMRVFIFEQNCSPIAQK